MKEKLQWETPQIYSLDNEKIQSGQAFLGGTENQRAYIARTDRTDTKNPGPGEFVFEITGSKVYLTRNGTSCRTRTRPTKNAYFLYRASINAGSKGMLTGTRKNNLVAAQFAISCP